MAGLDRGLVRRAGRLYGLRRGDRYVAPTREFVAFAPAELVCVGVPI
jgi:hypothetical protein